MTVESEVCIRELQRAPIRFEAPPRALLGALGSYILTGWRPELRLVPPTGSDKGATHPGLLALHFEAQRWAIE